MTFATQFASAFTTLRAERGANLVTLAALRAALPDYDRASFDRELYALRRANLYLLVVAEGRHNKPAAEVFAAAIVEGDRRFAYVSRREA